MPFESDLIYKDKDTIVAELVAALLARIPNANTNPDSIWRMWIEMAAIIGEGGMLGLQLLHDDIFIQTMSSLALVRAGDQFGLPRKAGTYATGSVRFTGDGGTYIGLNTQVGAARPGEDTLIFDTTQDGTIPNPGVPVAPVATDLAVAGNLTGTYEWAVTFVTAAGETPIGAASNALVLAASKAHLAGIPVGGPGTTRRRIYRQKNGGLWQFVVEIADIVTVVYDDNIADGAVGGQPPDTSTAQAIVLTAQGEETGVDYNVAAGTITELVGGETGLTSVTNAAGFAGGSDPEDSEAFRLRLLDFIRNPKSGSKSDLEGWAETIDGVELATAIPNDNNGVVAAGHVTVRISGPGGSVPSAGVQAAVLAELLSHDLANITIHVNTFTPHGVNVNVAIDVATGFVLADVTPSVQNAIAAYLNSVPVGGTVYVAGIVSAIYGLPGVDTLVVTAPAADVVMGAIEKPIPGTIVVS